MLLSFLVKPSIKLTFYILVGLFFLNQTRKRGLIVSLICLVIWVGFAWQAVTVIQQAQTPTQQAQTPTHYGLSSFLIKQTLVITDEIELVQLDPIIETISELTFVVVEAETQTETEFELHGVWLQIVRWQPQIEKAARECGVEEALIMAVMRQESVGDSQICSKAGACGLMQLMPGTAQALGVTNRFDPDQNVRGGACYLRQMLDRYGDTKIALAAYNAGPGNVDLYGGIPPFAETQLYVKNVLAFYEQVRKPAAVAPAAPEGEEGECCQWPVTGRITQQPSGSHMALDIAATLGTPIQAAASGQVIAASWDSSGYGKRIIIDHSDGLKTLYAHLSSFAIKEGDYVKAGQLIGRVGSTGRSTGPHLHFEVRQDGVLQNPWSYLQETP